MTNHEKFLDAMCGVDERFLSVHIRKKCPTDIDRIKKYAMAAAMYAAAIIAVAVILPFVIRHGEDPTPQPGDDPVVVETVVTSDGTEPIPAETTAVTQTTEATTVPPETTPYITTAPPETTPEVTTAPPPETTTTTPPETTTTTAETTTTTAPETTTTTAKTTTTTTPAPAARPKPETTPAITISPLVVTAEPSVTDEPKPAVTSESSYDTSEMPGTTTDWYFSLHSYESQFNNYKSTIENHCFYIVGWDKDYHVGNEKDSVDESFYDKELYYLNDDVLNITVVFVNKRSETIVFKDDNYSRNPLSNIVIDFSYGTYSNPDMTEGRTEMRLEPDDVLTYTMSLDLNTVHDLISWHETWEITSYIEYYVGDVKYSDSITFWIGLNFRI